MLNSGMNSNPTMPYRPFRLILICLIGLMLICGCEKTYEPAAYKAAPRVDMDQLSASGSTAKAKLPDITDWTSSGSVRGIARGGSSRGYSGIRGYRGIAGRGYSGLRQPYRGYAGQTRSYRGFGKSSGPYRGNTQLRNYRGRR